jgi:hypothetical protein
VANSLALRTAGINRATKDPPGGEILRDARSGEPTGMLVDRAQEIIAKFLPRQTPERIREALLLGARQRAAGLDTSQHRGQHLRGDRDSSRSLRQW